MLARKLSLFERAIIFIASFLVVVFAMFRFRIWSMRMTNFFFRTDRWLELIFVVAVATAIAMFLTWLLQLEFSIFAGVPTPRKRRKRRH
ncbi:MAG: hypothetical protein J7L44_00340 [Candidatus Diapherotrites archaeon]|nr:hypothetical protein [Candidatus Diapherotrites archaeon]